MLKVLIQSLLLSLLLASNCFAQTIPLPFSGANDTESVSATTSSVPFTLGFNSNQVLVTVDSDVTAFIKCGETAQTATIATASFHMGKGTRTFTKPYPAKSCAVILATGTATIYVTPGSGFQ